MESFIASTFLVKPVSLSNNSIVLECRRQLRHEVHSPPTLLECVEECWVLREIRFCNFRQVRFCKFSNTYNCFYPGEVKGVHSEVLLQGDVEPC